MRDREFRECSLEQLKICFTKKVTLSCNVGDKDPANSAK